MACSAKVYRCRVTRFKCPFLRASPLESCPRQGLEAPGLLITRATYEPEIIRVLNSSARCPLIQRFYSPFGSCFTKRLRTSYLTLPRVNTRSLNFYQITRSLTPTGTIVYTEPQKYSYTSYCWLWMIAIYL